MLLTLAKGRVAWELEWVAHPPVPSSAEFWSDPQQWDSSRLAGDTPHCPPSLCHWQLHRQPVYADGRAGQLEQGTVGPQEAGGWNSTELCVRSPCPRPAFNLGGQVGGRGRREVVSNPLERGIGSGKRGLLRVRLSCWVGERVGGRL